MRLSEACYSLDLKTVARIDQSPTVRRADMLSFTRMQSLLVTC